MCRLQMTGGNRQYAILGYDPPGFLAAFALLVEKHGISSLAGKVHMSGSADIRSSKVPQVTLVFWIIKIAATTLGETGGDALSMTFDLGYAVSTAIFFVFFAATVAAQIRARSFHPFLYWAVIVATTTMGTTMADFADRSLGVGYVGGSLILFTLVLLVLGLWWRVEGSVSVKNITSPRVEAFELMARGAMMGWKS